MSTDEIVVVDKKADITGPLLKLLEDVTTSHSASTKFRVAIAGGSAIPMLADALKAAKDAGKDLKTASWQIWLVDERVVPLDHADSNYGAFIKTIFENPAIWPEKRPENIFAVKTTGTAAEAAADYEQRARAEFGLSAAHGEEAAAGGGGASSTAATTGGLPAFDLLLLGMGEDGHVASLFPGSPLLGISAADAAAGTAPLVAPVTDSPKPPSNRVTFTLPVLNNAKNIAYLVAGAGKADPLASIFSPSTAPHAQLPAGRVHAAAGGKTVWFMDAPAAAKLPAGTKGRAQ